MNNTDKQTMAEWTIMVYLAADDILANFAIESLRQLRRAAGKDIVVAAQLDVDGPFARQQLRRYIFDGLASEDAKIDNDVVERLDPATNMVDPRTLTDFIDWVYQQSRCNAKHHCFILWGHGPELLAEPAPAGSSEQLKTPVTGGSTGQYLTPPQLAEALENSLIHAKHPMFEIIGLDACSSSIVEIAGELGKYARFMVASQEDVPDMSFPYQRLLQRFRASEEDVAGICKIGVQGYLKNYQDYVFGLGTGTSQVTLSTLNLATLDSVANPIKKLADALLSAVQGSRQQMGSLILRARKKSHGFVAGLFVDIFDFCDKLLKELQIAKITDPGLREACQNVLTAFAPKYDSFILANATLNPTQCHGLSIYLPFLTPEDKQQMGSPLTKGGTDILNKGGTDILNKGGTDILNKIRQQRISEIEQYYPYLEFEKSNWYEFIKHGWSRILVEQLQPGELDVHYSTQQCLANLISPAGGQPLVNPRTSKDTPSSQTKLPVDKASRGKTLNDQASQIDPNRKKTNGSIAPKGLQ